MHVLNEASDCLVVDSQRAGDERCDDGVTPIRAARVRVADASAAAADLGQGRPHKVLLRRDLPVWPADLRHGRRDEVGVDEMHRYPAGGEFRGKRVRPLLQEGFAARVGCQQG